ncbi:response regulator [Limnobacter alexandrii]|uniref:response regulator n=1 Tax=Limnobacter alexandrii TaxID=2570352 RepID=UPI001107F9B7|nr:response regulator [Limnobacter alexandrii]
MKKNCTNQFPFRVLLVEDSVELQAMLQAMLCEIPSVKVIGSVGSEQEALEMMRSECADLAIVDLELESGTGLGVLKSLNDDCMQLNNKLLGVVVFSNYSNLVIRHRCLSLGAKAFFDKSFQIDELLEFVQQQALGRTKGLSV